MEAVKRSAAQIKRAELYFYRTLKRLEVDLQIESGGKLDTYKIKWTQSPDKSLTSFSSSTSTMLTKFLPIRLRQSSQEIKDHKSISIKLIHVEL